VPDHEGFRLPLCALGAGAVRGLCAVLILPLLITLPGTGVSELKTVIIDVEVMAAAPAPVVAATSTNQGPAEPAPTATASTLSTEADRTDQTSALPPQSTEPPAASNPAQ
jgi:hypothetical protein